jgi:putative zinc finger protein/WD40 repeat protein
MSRGKTQSRLTHEEVVERFVDYHFGRLSPTMNRAVEAHIRSCPRCKREGMNRAASERQAANRKLRRVRGGKPLLSPRARLIVLAIAVLITAQLVLMQVTRGQAKPLLSLVGEWRAQDAAPALGGPPIALSASGRLPDTTAGASAIALSASGKALAVAQGGAHPGVSLWNPNTRSRIVVLPWTPQDAPASLAWSADGSLLAAASPTQIVIWSVAEPRIVWRLSLPASPAVRVYDVSQQAIIASPEPATVFSDGPLAWGADGSLTPAPAGAAGPTSITSPQTPVVGFWSSEGAHLFGDGHGSVHLGVTAADVLRGVSLLDWSPDGRYLMWASLNMPISGDGASSASAPPDEVVQALAKRVLATSKSTSAPDQNDALLWFAPNASRVAVCDRTRANAGMLIYDIASGAVAATLDVSCAGLSAHAAQWTADGSRLFIASARGPIAVYIAPTA